MDQDKIMVYKAVVIPTLLYWTPYKDLIKKMNSFHLRSLRQICRIQWTDMIPNYEVLQKCKIGGIESFLIKNQLRWVGHTLRMSNERIPKMLMYGELTNAPRKVGRPLLRYKDKLKSNLKALDIDLRGWEEVSKQRDQWRFQTHSKVNAFEQQRIQKMKQSRLQRKLRSHSVSSPLPTGYSCPVCGKVCRSAAGLGSHRRSHR